MGLKNVALNLIFLKSTPFKVLWTAIRYTLRLKFGLPNYNFANHWNKKDFIAQPRFFNDLADINLKRLVRAFLWSSDLNSVFKSSTIEENLRAKYEYDFMVKRYFPTKGTAYENMNMNMAWNNSFWNPHLAK